MDDSENRHWKELFDEYDKDHDGLIPLQDLSYILTERAHAYDLPRDKHDEILMRADRNKDGHLDYSEFVRIMSSPKPRLNFFQKAIKMGVDGVVPLTSRTKTSLNYAQHYNCLPPPLFMIVVSIVEVIIFIYYCVKLGDISADGPVPMESALIYNPHKRQEAWRWFTYMFIHAGAIHITFNLIIQIILGIPLEMVHKWWRILFVYMCGVIGGSLGTSVVDPLVYLAGASGGVYAILAAHLSNVIMNWKEMQFGWFRLIFIVVLIGADVATALYYRYVGTETGVGYAAHGAGALAGLLIGIVTLRNLDVEPWEEKVWWLSLGIFFALVVSVLWNVFFCGFHIDNLSTFCT